MGLEAGCYTQWPSKDTTANLTLFDLSYGHTGCMRPGSCHGSQLRQRFSIPSMPLLLGRASLNQTISRSALSANQLSKHKFSPEDHGILHGASDICWVVFRLLRVWSWRSCTRVPRGMRAIFLRLITCTAQGSKAFLTFLSNPTNSSPPL